MRSRLLAPLVGAVLAAGCDAAGLGPAPVFPTVTPTEIDAQQLGAARLAWERHAPAAYSFVIDQGNMWFSHLHRVTVVNGEVTRAVDLETGEILTADEREALPDIRELFEQLDAAVSAHHDWVGAAFHPLYQFPQAVFVDPHLSWADEEFYFRVGDFRAIR